MRKDDNTLKWKPAVFRWMSDVPRRNQMIAKNMALEGFGPDTGESDADHDILRTMYVLHSTGHTMLKRYHVKNIQCHVC